MKKSKAKLGAQPASFWVGVAFVAEFPVALAILFGPKLECTSLIEGFIACPLPLWTIVAMVVVSYVFVLFLALRLGLVFDDKSA